jgi:hypothetical protein
LNAGVTDSSPPFALLSIQANEAQSLAERSRQTLVDAGMTPSRPEMWWAARTLDADFRVALTYELE